MEIIDMREVIKERLVPICRFKDEILFMEADKKEDPFSIEVIKNYFFYNLISKEIKKVDIGKEKVIYDIYHENSIEGEDGFYYIIQKKQLFLNEYIVYSINMETYTPEEIFRFSEEKKFRNFLIEKIDYKRLVVFFKEDEDLSFEDFENMDYGRDKYGFDKGVLYDIETKKSYEINDKHLKKGLKGVFYITILKGEKVIVYEENYLESFQKEQIYMDIHMHRASKKDKFYYHDSIKYISIDKFVEEVEKGEDKLSFISIEDRGIEGYELFIWSDEKTIFYEVDTYGKEDGNNIIFLNRETLDKKNFTLKNQYQDRFTMLAPSYFNYLEGREKYIFALEFISENKAKVKELIRGLIDYTYDIKEGSVKECIEDRYLVLKKGNNHLETTLIDIKENKIDNYKREHKVFEKYLILY